MCLLLASVLGGVVNLEFDYGRQRCTFMATQFTKQYDNKYRVVIDFFVSDTYFSIENDLQQDFSQKDCRAILKDVVRGLHRNFEISLLGFANQVDSLYLIRQERQAALSPVDIAVIVSASCALVGFIASCILIPNDRYKNLYTYAAGHSNQHA